MTGKVDNVRQDESKTRMQRRQARVIARAERIQKQNQKTEAVEKRVEKRPIKSTRLIPIWLRLIIVAVLLVISMTAGLMFGYGVIGDGKAFDALKISTWNHLVDLVVKGTDEK